MFKWLTDAFKDDEDTYLFNKYGSTHLNALKSTIDERDKIIKGLNYRLDNLQFRIDTRDTIKLLLQ